MTELRLELNRSKKIDESFTDKKMNERLESRVECPTNVQSRNPETSLVESSTNVESSTDVEVSTNLKSSTNVECSTNSESSTNVEMVT